jgi:hypothetical protein
MKGKLKWKKGKKIDIVAKKAKDEPRNIQRR